MPSTTIYIVTLGWFSERANVRAFRTQSAADAFKRASENRECSSHDYWERYHNAKGRRPMGPAPYLSEWDIEELELED